MSGTVGLNSVTNTEEYGGRTCLLVLCFLSLSIFFIYITMAQTDKMEKCQYVCYAYLMSRTIKYL